MLSACNRSRCKQEPVYLNGINIHFSGCSFLTKTINAENAGALAAIIFDNQEDNDESMIDMIQMKLKELQAFLHSFYLEKTGKNFHFLPCNEHFVLKYCPGSFLNSNVCKK